MNLKKSAIFWGIAHWYLFKVKFVHFVNWAKKNLSLASPIFSSHKFKWNDNPFSSEWVKLAPSLPLASIFFFFCWTTLLADCCGVVVSVPGANYSLCRIVYHYYFYLHPRSPLAVRICGCRRLLFKRDCWSVRGLSFVLWNITAREKKTNKKRKNAWIENVSLDGRKSWFSLGGGVGANLFSLCKLRWGLWSSAEIYKIYSLFPRLLLNN